MENPQFQSVDEFRAALSHLLTRSKKNPFIHNVNLSIRLG
jgi:hypothetical protein